MKVLVVSLALTIFAGSQAFVLRDESPSKLRQLETDLGNDMDNLWNAVAKKGDIVDESEIGQVLRTWINERQTQLEQRMETLMNAFPPEVKEIGNRVPSALNDAVSIPINAYQEMNRELYHELHAFHQALEHDLDPILEKLQPYGQLLHNGLVKVGTGLNEKLNEMLKWSVERLQPLAKEMPSKLQEVHGSLEPIVDRAQKAIVTQAENARDTLQPVASSVLGVLRKYGEFLHERANTPFFP